MERWFSQEDMIGQVDRLAIALILLAFCTCALAQERVSASDERALSAFSEDRHRQFDFWIGTWSVNLRMLQEDLTFKDSVTAKAHIYSILNGKAILELWDSEPIKGYSLRYYDPKDDQWILWLDWPSNNQSIISRLTGEFRHGRGDFMSGFTTSDGQEITQRYSFNDITPFSLRWDDLFSIDGGKTWQKNWRMEFTRTALEPEWPLENAAFPTYDTGARCDDAKFRGYESLVGHWRGEIDGDNASIASWHVLDGCAVIAFLDIDSQPSKKRFMFLTYETANENWEVDYLDDDYGSGMQRLVSKDGWTTTSNGNQELRWDVEQDRLEYRFQDADQSVETGQFERQQAARPR